MVDSRVGCADKTSGKRQNRGLSLHRVRLAADVSMYLTKPRKYGWLAILAHVANAAPAARNGLHARRPRRSSPSVATARGIALALMSYIRQKTCRPVLCINIPPFAIDAGSGLLPAQPPCLPPAHAPHRPQQAIRYPLPVLVT